MRSVTFRGEKGRPCKIPLIAYMREHWNNSNSWIERAIGPPTSLRIPERYENTTCGMGGGEPLTQGDS